MEKKKQSTKETKVSNLCTNCAPKPSQNLDPRLRDPQSFLLDKINEWLPLDKNGLSGQRKFNREKFISLFSEFILQKGYDVNKIQMAMVMEYLDSLLPRGNKEFARCAMRPPEYFECELELHCPVKKALRVSKGVEPLGRFSEALLVFLKGQAEHGHLGEDFVFPEETAELLLHSRGNGSREEFTDLSEAFSWMFADDC